MHSTKNLQMVPLNWSVILRWATQGPRALLFLFLGERGSKKSPKVGSYQPASKTPLKRRFAGGLIMAHIEC